MITMRSSPRNIGCMSQGFRVLVLADNPAAPAFVRYWTNSGQAVCRADVRLIYLAAPSVDATSLGYRPVDVCQRTQPRAEIPKDQGPLRYVPSEKKHRTAAFKRRIVVVEALCLWRCLGFSLIGDRDSGSKLNLPSARNLDMKPVSYTHLTLPTKRI